MFRSDFKKLFSDFLSALVFTNEMMSKTLKKKLEKKWLKIYFKFDIFMFNKFELLIRFYLGL